MYLEIQVQKNKEERKSMKNKFLKNLIIILIIIVLCVGLVLCVPQIFNFIKIKIEISNTLKSISSKQNRFHMTLTKTKRTISQTKCDYKIRKENLYTFEAKGVHEDLGKVILQNKKILFKPVKLCKSMTLPSLKPREPTPKPKHHRKTKIPIRIQLSTDDEVFEYMKIAM